MRLLKIFLIGFLQLLIACQGGGSSYEVVTKSKIIKNEDCEVPVDYPQIEWKFNKKDDSKINELLERLPDHKYYARNCSSENPQSAKDNFKVLLKTDSVLCIEYQTEVEYRKEHRTVFHSIVINPNKVGSIDFRSIIVDPQDVIPNFDRGKILPYIEKYNLEHNDKINALAYQTGSRYVITWGITESHFVIYPGGEGEFYGDDKIEIPLNELK